MSNLILIDDRLELEGVTLFRATSELTPARRLMLRDCDVLSPDGVLADARAHDINYEKGYDDGVEDGRAEAESDADEARVEAREETALKMFKGAVEFADAFKLNENMRRALFRACLDPLDSDLREQVRKEVLGTEGA